MNGAKLLARAIMAALALGILTAISLNAAPAEYPTTQHEEWVCHAEVNAAGDVEIMAYWDDEAFTQPGVIVPCPS